MRSSGSAYTLMRVQFSEEFRGKWRRSFKAAAKAKRRKNVLIVFSSKKGGAEQQKARMLVEDETFERRDYSLQTTVVRTKELIHHFLDYDMFNRCIYLKAALRNISNSEGPPPPLLRRKSRVAVCWCRILAK